VNGKLLDNVLPTNWKIILKSQTKKTDIETKLNEFLAFIAEEKTVETKLKTERVKQEQNR